VSPRAGDRRRITGRQIGAAGAGAAMIAIAIGVLSTIGGSGSNIPTPAHETVRIDLLASRDLDTTTPCGLPAGGTGDTKPRVSDQTWTRTGGSSCYPISATAAQCFDATEIPYTVDATGLGWVVEPDSVNRILYSGLGAAPNCTNWTCVTSTIDATTDPTGGSYAAAITHGGGTVDAAGTGYANSAAVYPRVWVKCSSGTLTIAHQGGTGSGTVDCTALGGVWSLVTPTNVASWTSTGAGVVTMRFSGADASVWAPTVTEEPGTGLSVIPTGAAAVSTGDPEWAISNGLRNTGSQLLVDGDMEAVGVGDWTAISSAAMTKESGTPHSGTQVLRVAYGGITNPMARQFILSVGTAYRAVGWWRGDATYLPRLTDGVVVLTSGTTSTAWQPVDHTFIAAGSGFTLLCNASGAGYCEFDDFTVYEQESYGAYYRPGDTVTRSNRIFYGTCWDPLTTTGDLLLSGLDGTQCAGIWYGLQVTP